VYHAAYPGFGASEDSVTKERFVAFRQLTGKRIVWAYVSNHWGDTIVFPRESVRIFQDRGVIPFIRMMPWSYFHAPGPDSVYTLQRVIDGQFDAQLRMWARDARASGSPLMLEFGPEVNAEWFPWNGGFNGGETADAYGDPTLADGPERFRDAYRHLVRLFREEGATNVTWAYHVLDPALAAGRGPATIVSKREWDALSDYYPGDDYVDWIGVSIYGPLRPGRRWRTFVEILDQVYPVLAAISATKPLAIFEFGVVDDPATGDKAEWISAALQAIESGRYPRIKAVSYWHESWVNDDGTLSNVGLDSSAGALDAYRAAIASRYYLTTAEFR
jgi:hypothetical protein